MSDKLCNGKKWENLNLLCLAAVREMDCTSCSFACVDQV